MDHPIDSYHEGVCRSNTSWLLWCAMLVVGTISGKWEVGGGRWRTSGEPESGGAPQEIATLSLSERLGVRYQRQFEGRNLSRVAQAWPMDYKVDKVVVTK